MNNNSYVYAKKYRLYSTNELKSYFNVPQLEIIEEFSSMTKYSIRNIPAKPNWKYCHLDTGLVIDKDYTLNKSFRTLTLCFMFFTENLSLNDDDKQWRIFTLFKGQDYGNNTCILYKLLYMYRNMDLDLKTITDKVYKSCKSRLLECDKLDISINKETKMKQILSITKCNELNDWCDEHNLCYTFLNDFFIWRIYKNEDKNRLLFYIQMVFVKSSNKKYIKVIPYTDNVKINHSLYFKIDDDNFLKALTYIYELENMKFTRKLMEL